MRPEKWAERPIAADRVALVPCPAMAAQPFTNVDFLDWFTEEERDLCAGCGVRACVSFDEAKAAFCLACGAVEVDGRRILA